LKYIKVDRGIFRGPHPESDEDFVELKKLDIRFTLDLETGAKWVGDQSPLFESIKADMYLIRTYPHPLGTFLPPSISELGQAWNFLIHKREYGNILIHCAHGVDRTGLVVAYWRITENKWELPMAIAEMKHFGFHWIYFYWIWFFKRGVKK
jgi:hypothetical protein